jgi:hypothetical protein
MSPFYISSKYSSTLWHYVSSSFSPQISCSGIFRGGPSFVLPQLSGLWHCVLQGYFPTNGSVYQVYDKQRSHQRMDSPFYRANATLRISQWLPGYSRHCAPSWSSSGRLSCRSRTENWAAWSHQHMFVKSWLEETFEGWIVTVFNFSDGYDMQYE